MSDIDDDGIPDIVERALGQDLVGPKDVERAKAIADVAGRIVDATEEVIERVGGQAAVDAAGDIVDNVIEGLGAQAVSMALPEEPPTRRVELTDVRDDASIEDFIVNVLAQLGDRYQRGVDNSLRDADPDSWDGSELVEWGANRAGSMVNDGAQNQYKQMVRHGGDVTVDVALVTPGAVLYEFTGDPSGSVKPTRASTAISLGDGKHIIDIDPVHGVRIVEAKDFTFTHAGVMPGFVDSHNPGPVTHALVEDALKAAGLEPGPALEVVTPPSSTPPDADTDASPARDQLPTESTDDDHGPEIEVSPASDDGAPPPAGAPPAPVTPATSTPPTASSTPAPPDTAEISALAGRAAQLRDRYNDRLSSQERIDLVDRRDDIGLQRATTRDGAAWSKRQLEDRLEQARDRLVEATELDRRAVEAQAAGRGREAEDLREQADAASGNAKALEALAERSRADIAKSEAELTRLDRDHAAADERLEQWDANRLAAEKVIDVVEDKVRLLREAEAHEQRAKSHDDDAQWFRDNGDPQEADNRAAMATRARADADAARTTSRSTDVDEGVLRTGGLLTGDETLDTVPVLPPTASTPAGPTRTVIEAADDTTPPAIERTDVSPRPAGGPQAATDPAPPSTEETPAPHDPGAPQQSIGDRVAGLEARAAGLRAEMLQRMSVDRAQDMDRHNDLIREQAEAQHGSEVAEFAAGRAADQAEESTTKAADLDRRATEADQAGNKAQAAELREDAAVARAAATRQQTASDRAQAEVARLKELQKQKEDESREVGERYQAEGRALTEAEKAIDQIEAKAQHLRESEAHATRAVDLESEAALLRDQGKTSEADAKHAAAAKARSAARQSETLAAAQAIDEAKLSEAGLLGGPTTTETTNPPQASLLDDVTGADATSADAAAAGTADTDAPAAADEGGDASVDATPDPTVADAPTAPVDDPIDAHAAAAFLVPDMPDASQGAAADGDSGSDPWADTTADDAAPTSADDTTPDLEA